MPEHKLWCRPCSECVSVLEDFCPPCLQIQSVPLPEISNPVYSAREHHLVSRRSEETSGGELVHGYETEGGIRALSHPIFQSCDVDTYSRSRSLFDGRLQEQAKFYVVLEQRFLPGDESDQPAYTESSMKALVLQTAGTGRAVLWLRAASTYDLRLWKTGDCTWTPIRSPSAVEDITIFDGQFVALYNDGALCSINPSTRTAELLCPWKIHHSSRLSTDPRRLVVSRSTLYVVESGFRVSMLVKNTWNTLIDMGGRALLWGHQCSFMVEQSDLCGQFRPNYMYRYSGVNCSECNNYYPLNPSGSRPPVVYNNDDISELDLNNSSPGVNMSQRSGQMIIQVFREVGARPGKCKCSSRH